MKTNYPVRNAQQAAHLHSVRVWLKAKDAFQCQKFAEKMGQNKNADGLPALMELLRLPSGFWQRRPTAAMCAAREAAVSAIAQIDAPDMLSCLGTALFNPCPGVRAAASQILHQAGDRAADPLCRMLNWKQNWSEEGMHVLLYTLGKTRQPSAGPLLARVIMGELPSAPPRWNNEVISMLVPAVLVEASVLFWLFYTVIGSGMNSFRLWIGLAALFLFLDFALVISARNSTRTNERRSLAVAGCEALKMLGDKKALETLLVNSRRVEPDIAAAAYEGVLALLPTLCAEDTEWMPLAVRRRLEAMLTLNDPNMVLAVLRAMEFVGTGQAEYRIQQLITYGAMPAIQVEAARILPIIAERAKQEKISGTLLRASQSPTNPQAELLRAAHSTAQNAPEELLRPAIGQGE